MFNKKIKTCFVSPEGPKKVRVGGFFFVHKFFLEGGVTLPKNSYKPSDYHIRLAVLYFVKEDRHSVTSIIIKVMVPTRFYTYYISWVFFL